MNKIEFLPRSAKTGKENFKSPDKYFRSVGSAHLCHCRAKAVRGSMEVRGHGSVPIRLSQNRLDLAFMV